ncbi:hypothetical protein KIW84_023933 [Lathyrus oleraceus]|uniref:Uncharacterized protein n=1 Tax=Pisum sativum TaxID=3888 RepID=A0A9D4YE80_PEA|nr:hypothetical protein KIW84_023933 [Pisum sativum]
MVKVKRFSDPLKSPPQIVGTTHPPPQAQPHATLQTQSPTQYQAPSLRPSPLAQCPTHIPSHPPTQTQLHSTLQTQVLAHSSHHIQDPTQTKAPIHSPTYTTPIVLSPTLEVPQQSQESRQCVGRESTQYWSVESIDLGGVIKKIKTTKDQVNNLSIGERVIVHFDDQGATYGEAQGLLAGYCGILAIDGNLFPISFGRWSGPPPSGMPKCYFEDCFKTDIKPRFCFRTTEALAERYCRLSIGKKWASHRQRLWDEFYNPTLTRDEIVSNVPLGVDKTQWDLFVNYRLKPSTKEEIEVSLTQSTNDESIVSPNDVIGKILGPEHPGRVRCLGMGATPSYTFRNTRFRLSDSGAFKAYIIMKEGRIPNELVGVFGPSNPANVAGESDSSKNVTEPNSPMDASDSDLPIDAREMSSASNI